MDRKRFLNQLGGAGLLTFLPLSSAKAFIKNNPLSKFFTKAKIVRDDEGTQLRIFGNPQFHKVVGTDTGEQVFEWVDDLAPGSGIPPHVHTKEDEIFRVLQGEVEVMVGDDVMVLKAGDMAFAPKNLVHSWKVVGEQKAKMWASAFPSGMEHMFHELHKMPAGPPDLKKVAAICETYGIQFV
ncbi:cupin domain-containing protein [Croceitalea rosinachiae]|uniref:Cupin domain-containing protein n=1 Tax=Croceitalea rosinachiae TaxID=3075596 RepID=A0ABU3A8A5_9FLAO|nr:cupin domain-containing protein [Croceitalea sp. F388]MDT0606105.1 cupin domain-containing protein [Croceitalea sp. F388]